MVINHIKWFLMEVWIYMILGLHHAQITIPKGAEEEGKHFYCMY